MVVCISADELSTVTPPDCSCFCFSGSFVDRSGEMRSHESPRSRERKRNCEPRYSVPLRVGLVAMGVFQLKRSFSLNAALGWMSRVACVRRLTRPM